jgi:hypothetical protein
LDAFLLAQDIIPMPAFQMLEHCHGAKFPISDQPDGDPRGQQRAHIGQESQLLADGAMTFDVGDSGSGDGDGALTVS